VRAVLLARIERNVVGPGAVPATVARFNAGRGTGRGWPGHRARAVGAGGVFLAYGERPATNKNAARLEVRAAQVGHRGLWFVPVEPALGHAVVSSKPPRQGIKKPPGVMTGRLESELGTLAAKSCTRSRRSANQALGRLVPSVIDFAVTKHLRRCGAINSENDREINDGGY
jgi:hypothetical protein